MIGLIVIGVCAFVALGLHFMIIRDLENRIKDLEKMKSEGEE